MDQLKPPEQLLINSPNKADAWRRFKQAFEFYSMASGLKDKDGAIQAAVFFHIIGEDSQKMYQTLQFDTEEDKKDIDKLKEKFEEFCVPKANATMERYCLIVHPETARK